MRDNKLHIGKHYSGD